MILNATTNIRCTVLDCKPRRFIVWRLNSKLCYKLSKMLSSYVLF